SLPLAARPADAARDAGGARPIFAREQAAGHRAARSFSPSTAPAMSHPRLSLFDLDNTLLNGDSDYAWASYLIDHGILDGEEYRRRNDAYYADYLAGRLDIMDFLDFQLAPLAQHALADLLAWRKAFVHERISPMILEEGRKVVAERLAAGDLVAIVTAT